MVTFSYVSNKRSRFLRGPASYYEMTTELYIKIILEWDSRDHVLLFCILFDCRDLYDALFNSKEEKVEEMIMKGIRFMYTDDIVFDELPIPKMFKGRIVPDDLGRLSYGQSMNLRQYAEGKTVEECIPYALAIYMQPLIDNSSKVDMKRVKILAEEFKQFSIIDTYPIGMFFLRQLQHSGKISKILSSILVMIKKLREKMRTLKGQPEQRDLSNMPI